MTEEDAVVKVAADGQTRYYKAIDDAFTDENQDGTVTLMKDVTNGHTIYVTGGPYILDLNGCDMSSVSEDSVTVTVGKADGDKGNLTVKDSGTDGRLEKLVVESGSLTVGNGSFGFVGDNASSCIGSINFKGGHADEFKINSRGYWTDDVGNFVDGLRTFVLWRRFVRG